MKYSVKMRASKNIDDKDLHIGGAEKIIDESELLSVVSKLTLRGLKHSRGEADFVNLKINKVCEEAVSYTHLTLPTTARRCRSRWSPYH